MGYALSFLLGSEAAEMRTQRAPKFVVHVELFSGKFTELDAEDVDHGHRLACDWCEREAAQSAAVRRVFDDGSLSKVVGEIHSSHHTPMHSILAPASHITS